MSHHPRVAAPAYLAAAILLLFAILDLAQATWPPRVGELGWRVLAVGLVSRIMVTPILGLLLAHAAAVVAEHGRVLKVMSVLNAALALVIIAGLGVFALDALQMRTQVGPDSRNSYDLGLSISFVKFGIGVLFLIFLSVVQWKSGARMARESTRKASSAPPLVLKKSSAAAATSQAGPVT